MELVTLGGLELEGSAFHRVKPLLLTYVALEGLAAVTVREQNPGRAVQLFSATRTFLRVNHA